MQILPLPVLGHELGNFSRVASIAWLHKL